jgi:putative membrane protein
MTESSFARSPDNRDSLARWLKGAVKEPRKDMKIQNKILMAFAGSLALLLTAGGATAADNGSGDQRGQFSEKDYKFIKQAAMGGMEEVQLGELAQQKGQNQAVKDFGQRMVTDHNKANNELRDLVTRKGATLPSETTHHERSTIDSLQKANGAEFDKEYASAMVKDHKKDLKEFQNAAQNCTDPDLKAFAEKTVSTLQEHLQLAQQMDSSVRSQKQ